jgi:glyoxylase-like metal-dependent hydrolase (beta-lactamase superfamily II)
MDPLDVQRIDQGLWRWSVPHPEWKPEKGGPAGWDQRVGCVYYEAPDAVVLIDPLVPADGTPDLERFWTALDRDVERAARPVEILLANHFHVRSAAPVRERYRSAVWAHSQAPIDLDVAHRFDESTPLPGGIHAFAITALYPGEVVFHIPSHRALVPADAILGAGNGKLRLPPAGWAEAGEAGPARYARLRPELTRLLDLSFDRVLVSHGEPVLTGGKAALEAALRGEVSNVKT